MALEAATFINDLVSTNPVGTDQKAQGDDHIRLVKSASKATFPGASKAFYFPVGLAKAGAYTIVIADENAFIPADATTAAFSLTLPLGSTLNSGYKVTVIKADKGPNAVTIARSGADTINGATSWVLVDPYEGADLIWVGTEWLVRGFGQHAQDQTGDLKWRLQSGALTGFLKLNGTTFGSASSGAAQRANADTQALFTYLWTNVADAVATVGGGRGASAAADWTANKTITSPDLRGRGIFGLDTMGAAAAADIIKDARITGGGGDSDTQGGIGGAELHTLLEAELPAVAPTFTGIEMGTHVHTASTTATKEDVVGALDGPRNSNEQSLGAVTVDPVTAGTPAGTISNLGSGTAFDKLSPLMLGTWFMKL